MSIAPFSTRPGSAPGERRRTRLALASAIVGIAATLLAYAISPGVRHVVGRAEHSVKHAVSRVFDRDNNEHRKAPSKQSTRPGSVPAAKGTTTSSKSTNRASSP